MDDSVWHAVAACGTQVLCGALALALFTRRRDLGLRLLGLAWPAVCWSLGAVSVAAGGVVLAALDVRMTPMAWMPLALGAAAIFGGAARRLRAPDPEPAREPPRMHPFWWIFAVVWIAFAVDWIAISNYLPVFQGDEASIWSAKAKALFGLSGERADLGLLLTNDRLPGQRAHVHMAAYPWLAALLEAHVYAWAGDIVHFTSRVPLQIFVALSVLATAEIARRSTAPMWWTLPLVLVLATDANTIGALGYGLSLGQVIGGVVLLLLAPSLDPRLRGGVEALALVQLVASKSEGAAIFAAWVLATLAVRWTRRRADAAEPRHERRLSRAFVVRSIATAAPALVLFAVHQIANRAWGLEHHLASVKGPASDSTHFVESARNVLLRHLFDFDVNGALTGLALVAFLLAPAARRRAAPALFAAVLWLGVATIYYLVLSTSPYAVEWQWLTAGPRIYAHIAPAAVVASFALLARDPDATARRVSQEAQRRSGSTGTDPQAPPR